jgi:hypothetical protein
MRAAAILMGVAAVVVSASASASTAPVRQSSGANGRLRVTDAFHLRYTLGPDWRRKPAGSATRGSGPLIHDDRLDKEATCTLEIGTTGTLTRLPARWDGKHLWGPGLAGQRLTAQRIVLSVRRTVYLQALGTPTTTGVAVLPLPRSSPRNGFVVVRSTLSSTVSRYSTTPGEHGGFRPLQPTTLEYQTCARLRTQARSRLVKMLRSVVLASGPA